jgi:large subunit ribosomal protein L17
MYAAQNEEAPSWWPACRPAQSLAAVTSDVSVGAWLHRDNKGELLLPVCRCSGPDILQFVAALQMLQQYLTHSTSKLSMFGWNLCIRSTLRTTLHVLLQPKAKAARKYVDKMITLAKRGDDHARNQAKGFVYNADLVDRHQGGYCRVVNEAKIRRGDAAEMALLQFIDYEKPEDSDDEDEDEDGDGDGEGKKKKKRDKNSDLAQVAESDPRTRRSRRGSRAQSTQQPSEDAEAQGEESKGKTDKEA